MIPTFHSADSGFRSSDLEEVRSGLTEIFTSHELKLLDRSKPLETCVNEFSFGDSSLVYVRYGAPVVIEADQLKSCYLFQVVLSGDLEVNSHRMSQSVDASLMSIVSPQDVFKLRWGKDTGTLTIRLSRRAVELNLESIVGVPCSQSLEFHPLLDLSSNEGQQWMNVQEFTKKQLMLSAEVESDMGGVIEDTIARYALHVLPHNFSHVMNEKGLAGAPKTLHRAKAFLEANYHLDIDADTIAGYAGASTATLCKHFRRYLNLSPNEYLRSVRLEAVRAELLSADPGVKVAEVAIKNGFNHLSRFSGYYQQRFGESPSSTLRKQE